MAPCISLHYSTAFMAGALGGMRWWWGGGQGEGGEGGRDVGGGGRLQNASFFTPKPESFVQIRKMAMGTIIFYEILYSL